MLQFPPIPTWDAMHPLIVHFPIVLLLLSPIFIAISAALPPPRNRPYMLVALLILLLGTGSLFVAASTGEDAAELAERGGGVSGVLAAHERFASDTQILFSALLFILLSLFAWPRLLRRPETRVTSTVLPLAFLAVYSVGVIFLVNTAHAGGRLVHEFGVHAMIPQAREQVGASPAVKDAHATEKADHD
jgi:uncharacterized membrane protein